MLSAHQSSTVCMHIQVRPVVSMAADFGWPLWVFGISTYALLDAQHILALYNDPREAGITLAVIELATGQLHKVDTGFTSYGSPVKCVPWFALCVAGVACRVGISWWPAAGCLVSQRLKSSAWHVPTAPFPQGMKAVLSIQSSVGKAITRELDST